MHSEYNAGSAQMRRKERQRYFHWLWILHGGTRSVRHQAIEKLGHAELLPIEEWAAILSFSKSNLIFGPSAPPRKQK